MYVARSPRLLVVGGLIGYIVFMLSLSIDTTRAQQDTGNQPVLQQAPTGPTTSSPIAISNDGTLVAAVNPDDDTISIINTATNQLAVSNVRVGDEPQALAFDPTGQFIYVANAASNSVSVIQLTGAIAQLRAAVVTTLITGAEPWSVVVSPDGKRVFVANAGQDTITAIRADTNPKTIIGDFDLRNSACNIGDSSRHFQPRGLAVTATSQKLFVARFFSFTKSGGRQADDTGKEGIVCRLSVDTNAATGAGLTIDGPVALQPQITGFRIDSNGDGVADDTLAYPNQLQSIVLRGDQAYLPNIAASPSAPLRFNVDTHAFVNVIDGISAAAATGMTDAVSKSLNLHLGARLPETGKKRLFFANPWAIAFTNQSGAGSAYVVSAGSDLLVKVNVAADGGLSFTGSVSTTRYIDLNDPAVAGTSGANAGKNPLGIAINSAGTRAYVMNYISRNVSVVDTTTDAVLAVVKTTDLPPPGTLDETLQIGKEVFFSSRGVFDGGKTERLSSEGWQNCASCHFAGLTDANVWAFGAGPRKSVPLNATWDPRNPDDQRVLNYSAIFDEVEDFEANIRNVSGPGFLNPPTNTVLDPNHGLLIGDDGNIDAAPSVVNAFNRANAGRPQLTVTLAGSGRTGVPALTAMKEWVRFNVRTPNGPLTRGEIGQARGIGTDFQAIARGRALFLQAGCQSCHGGGKWTNSFKDFVSPPDPARVFTERTGTFTGNPIGAQYIADVLENIGSFNLNVAGQGNSITGTAQIGGVEKAATGQDALGIDYNGDGKGNGYNVPSLLGIHNVQPYYHNGACETLECVLGNVRHRTAGKPNRPDALATAQSRNDLIVFLESIDAATQPPVNLSIRRHDIASDPQRIFVGIPVTLTANISLFGPKIPAFAEGPLTVSFFDGEPGTNNKIGDAQLAGVPDDNGQVTVSVPWTPPNTPGIRRIFVQVDTANLFSESNERDNIANRNLLVRVLPPDSVRPVVRNVAINNDAVLTNSRNVTITFEAEDPASPAPAPTSGLDSFCVIRYFFNAGQRLWIPDECTFRPLQGSSPFTIQETIPPSDGVIYAFIVVRDRDGNLSSAGFDFINAAPAGPINLGNGNVRVFRLRLNSGQSVRFTATPNPGDVDITAFQGSTRVAVSAQIGSVAESVLLTATANNTIFTIQVEAFGPSRFTISFANALQAQDAEITQTEVIDPGREAPTEALTTNTPALNVAFEDLDTARLINLPLIAR